MADKPYITIPVLDSIQQKPETPEPQQKPAETWQSLGSLAARLVARHG